ncbi:helix-turn-helix domain-containing protein [Marinovum sp. 2_MG-2023]|uniref:sigma-54-dependent Fis family transcriptional regulator n=1 Tax=unclassified Marinovum TaxID=2647166 RepID=UPI0026E1C18A|nr:MULTISPECIES: sigma 54-interacting transcriptional regulator [unclassified Marinovum]MDO6731457.1 helix-turn-helix domain-containing protein [Marinovum sp. 2_MG-2023]MDO6780817.1 helix-turn-helix domain-containing protein [Marinovum sp. 1_MG-2023]
MNGISARTKPEAAVGASWERCERTYKLVRDAARPILRMQSAEVAPRLEEMVERTGGRNGIFRQLAGIAAETGACMVLTDTNGVLLRLEGPDNGRAVFEKNGIAYGSCWDERIAGTNGISMALSEGKAFTVRGKDHYFSLLHPFSCTAVPLFDAENQLIGVVNFSMLDRGNTADYLFARQLLGTAAGRIQHLLFERKFKDSLILSVSPRAERDLLQSTELVAVNDDGIILGATAHAHVIAGAETANRLRGKTFEAMFGADAAALDRVPERVMSVRMDHGSTVDIAARKSHTSRKPQRARPPVQQTEAPRPQRRRLSPSLKQLSLGSDVMATMAARAQACFRRSLPFLIEGPSGTGKSGLIAALFQDEDLAASNIMTVDCASLDDTPDDRVYFQTLVDQARVAGAFACDMLGPVSIVLENIDEMPGFAQAGLRSVLDEFDPAPTSGDMPRIIATSRKSLIDAVEQGRFRDDLYYLLARTVIALPPLKAREQIAHLAQALATSLSGKDVVITPEAAETLRMHHWPGNVRELRNVLQQALIEGDGRRISRTDLQAIAQNVPIQVGPRADLLPNARYDERAMIADALSGARWNVTQAARNLGIGRATIHRKMKQYGIMRPE